MHELLAAGCNAARGSVEVQMDGISYAAALVDNFWAWEVRAKDWGALIGREAEL